MKIDTTFTGKQSKIEYYKNLAKTIRTNIFSRKRPLIVEFTGLPKAGKTTVVNSLSLFLRRNDIPNIIVTERASVCPIKNKHHPDFNIWTACTSLVNILNYKQTNQYYVIIVDRGIFDALVWLNLLNKRGKLNEQDLSIFENFFLLERWRLKIDLVICMKAKIEIALEREFKDLLTDIEGSIMNKHFLTEFSEILDDSIIKYKPKFKNFIEMDTSETKTLEGVEKVISEVIKSLEILSNEELIVFPKEQFKEKLDFIGFDNERSKLQILERIITSHKSIIRRKEAEENEKIIQIIVCAIIKYKSSIGIFTKKEIGDKRLHNKKMIWAGGHLQLSDIEETDNITLLSSMKNCLKRELNEEIELDFDVNPSWKGLVYDNTHTKSLRHLGVVFQIDIKDEAIFKALNNKTFRELSGQGVSLEFIELNQAVFDSEIDELEPWSVDIIKKLFNINAKPTEDSEQMVIF